MSQHIPHHQTQYVHYTPPGHGQQQQQQQHQHPQQHGQHGQQHQQQQHQYQHHAITHVAPKDTQKQQQQQQQHVVPSQAQPVAGSSSQAGSASAGTSAAPTASTSAVPGTSAAGAVQQGPLIAKGDWTKDLVQLAKNAELKKHALTLQLHTAHILSAHASLDQKGKAIQDLTEQWNKLESERNRLLKCLHEVNTDKDKVELMRMSLEKECAETRTKISALTEHEYAVAKADVDRLRHELGQPPLPSLQTTLEEKTAQYLTERRLSGNGNGNGGGGGTGNGNGGGGGGGTGNDSHAGTPGAGHKRGSASQDGGMGEGSGGAGGSGSVAKRPRGRPKGSKNKSKAAADD